MLTHTNDNPNTGQILLIRDMGKEFPVRALTNSADEANRYMESNPHVGLITSIKGLHIIADLEPHK